MLVAVLQKHVAYFQVKMMFNWCKFPYLSEQV